MISEQGKRDKSKREQDVMSNGEKEKGQVRNDCSVMN